MRFCEELSKNVQTNGVAIYRLLNIYCIVMYNLSLKSLTWEIRIANKNLIKYITANAGEHTWLPLKH